jgi:hypothetical protein
MRASETTRGSEAAWLEEARHTRWTEQIAQAVFRAQEADAAGQRAAHAYTLVLSCYRLGMDPWAYLRDVLPKLGDTRFPASRLAEFLPEAWLQQQRQQL